MTDNAKSKQFYMAYVPSYCPVGTFARVSGKVQNKINKIKEDGRGMASGYTHMPISDALMDACVACATVPGLRCGEFDINKFELCDPGSQMPEPECIEWYGEYSVGKCVASRRALYLPPAQRECRVAHWTAGEKMDRLVARYLDPMTMTCLCPAALEKQTADRLTTLSVTLLPNYWRAFAWSEKVWPCVNGGGCRGDANSTDLVTTCGFSMAGSPTETNHSDGVCAGAALYKQMEYDSSSSPRGV